MHFELLLQDKKEEGRREGQQEGLREGRQKGRHEERVALIKTLMESMNLSVEMLWQLSKYLRLNRSITKNKFSRKSIYFYNDKGCNIIISSKKRIQITESVFFRFYNKINIHERKHKIYHVF